MPEPGDTATVTVVAPGQLATWSTPPAETTEVLASAGPGPDAPGPDGTGRDRYWLSPKPAVMASR